MLYAITIRSKLVYIDTNDFFVTGRLLRRFGRRIAGRFSWRFSQRFDWRLDRRFHRRFVEGLRFLFLVLELHHGAPRLAARPCCSLGGALRGAGAAASR